MKKTSLLLRIPLFLMLVVAVASTGLADRTTLKPGWNIFSPEQDVEIGRQVAQEADRELQFINDRQTVSYINSLGRRLAAKAPGERFPYQFRVVNDRAVNAFALPGGFIYINRGLIEAADNESQLASVVAHEIAHVALRHGTNQMSRAAVTQMPLEILGGALGGQSVAGVLAQLGVGFAANSILLKYSRDAERDADLMAVQILHDAGLDPRGSAQFFEKLQAKGGPIEFFRSHPNPENRIEKVNEEIALLGGVPASARADSAQFQQVRGSLASFATAAAGGRTVPAAPSRSLVRSDFGDFSLSHPNNWRGYGQGSVVALAPDGGVVSNSLTHGMLLARVEPERGQGQLTLEQGTDRLLLELRRSNPQMRLTAGRKPIQVGGQSGFLMEFENESPNGFRETNLLVTVMDPGGQLRYFVGVSPRDEFGAYRPVFEQTIASIRFE
jgi:hypothetical protein